MVEKALRPDVLQDEYNFIENMKISRENRGWSQTELARMMAAVGWETYTQMTVSRTEKHERPLRLSEAVALCDLLGTDMRRMTAPPSQLTAVQQLEKSLQDLHASKERLVALQERIRRQQAELHSFLRTIRSASDPEVEAGSLGWDIEELIREAEGALAWIPPGDPIQEAQ